MYLVTIINDNVETVINEVSTNTNNRVSGTIKQGINTINSFTFTIYPNNEGYNLISPLSTLVKVLNTKTNKYEFIGRVLSPTHSMSNNGLISKSYVCESELAYLLDTCQSYEEIHNISVRSYLERLIQVHNANTDSNKQFTVGDVDVVDNNDSLYRYIAYDTTKKNIDDDLIEKLGGELQIRYENGIRYLDYLQEIGKVCTTEIRLAKNLKDIEQNINIEGYCNRLIPLGGKLKEKDNEGTEVDTEYRLTIEEVNDGLRYIDDVESIAKYGVIQGQIIFEDVTKAENLLNKGKKHLLNQRLLVSNKVNALDLSLIGIDIDSFEVGNYYPLIHEILDINDTVRIVEKTISIDSPHTSTITLGDLEKDIKKINIQTKKDYLEAKSIAMEAIKVGKYAKNYTANEVYRLDDRVNTVIVDTNDSINNINNNLIDVDNNIMALNENLTIDSAILFPSTQGERIKIIFDNVNFTISIKFNLDDKPYILSKVNGCIIKPSNILDDRNLTLSVDESKIGQIFNFYINKNTLDFEILHFEQKLNLQQRKELVYLCSVNRSKSFFNGCDFAKENITIS